jgi:hypothetical protein
LDKPIVVFSVINFWYIVLQIVDARTISIVQSMTVSGADPQVMRRPASGSAGAGGSSAVAGARPRSSSGVRGGPSGVTGGGSVASVGSSRPSSAAGSSRPASAGRSRPASGGRPVSSNSNLSTPSTPTPSDDESMTKIIGLTVIAAAAVGGSGASVGTKSVQLIAFTNMGKAVRAEVGRWMSSTAPTASGAASGSVGGIRAAGGASRDTAVDIRPLFYYHSGPLTALSAEVATIGTMLVTGGDDKRLCVWDTVDRSLLTRTMTQV